MGGIPQPQPVESLGQPAQCRLRADLILYSAYALGVEEAETADYAVPAAGGVGKEGGNSGILPILTGLSRPKVRNKESWVPWRVGNSAWITSRKLLYARMLRRLSVIEFGGRDRMSRSVR